MNVLAGVDVSAGSMTRVSSVPGMVCMPWVPGPLDDATITTTAPAAPTGDVSRHTSLDQLAYEADEFGGLEGLGEEGVDADVETGVDLVLRAGADDGERKITGARVGTQPGGGAQTVEPGHHDVEGDDIGPDLMDDVQTLGTVSRGHDLETLQLEVDPDQLPDDLVVVHDKDPTGRAWHNSRVGPRPPPRPAFPHFHPPRNHPRPEHPHPTPSPTRPLPSPLPHDLRPRLLSPLPHPPRNTTHAPPKDVAITPERAGRVLPVAATKRPTRPRSSGDRATASGAVCAGSNPAGGTPYEVPKDPVTSGNAEAGVFAYVQADTARSGSMTGSVDYLWTGS